MGVCVVDLRPKTGLSSHDGGLGVLNHWVE